MGRVLPFVGLRYDPARVGGLRNVVAPPYDIIPPQEAPKYFRRSPYNIARIELARLTWPEAPDPYRAAAAELGRWQAEGVLRPDPAPGFYVYTLSFEWAGRRLNRVGLVGMVRIPDAADGTVLAHERTVPATVADRLELLRATRTATSPLFGLVLEDGPALGAELSRLSAALEPAAEVSEGAEHHRLAYLADPAALRRLGEVLAGAQVLVADGHHRFRAAQLFRDESRRALGDRPRAAWNHVLMVLYPAADPSLVILPTHRLIPDGPGPDQVLGRLEPHFEVRPFGGSARELASELEASDRPAFGLYGPGGLYLLTLRTRPEPGSGWPADRPGAWREVDVGLAQVLIIEGAFGVDDPGRLAYTRDLAEAVGQVEAGRYGWAVILRPPRAEEVVSLARAGVEMPPKSTYFHPKPLSGLVLAPLDQELPGAL